ncbi:MAG: hypothetical protein QXG39_04875 [Candidatus Aenigmatarchaeota archaeon]
MIETLASYLSWIDWNLVLNVVLGSIIFEIGKKLVKRAYNNYKKYLK